MKRLRLFQIGDIHYPSSISSSLKVDIKDPGFPQALVQIAASDGFRNTFRQIVNLSKDEINRVAGMLLCGDLTTCGDIDGYRQCLAYLDKCLEIKQNPDRWPPSTIHIVPGNHDINRAARDPEGEDFDKKFEPLSAEWNSFGLQLLQCNSYRATDIIANDDVKVRVFSLNSCIGCGERRYLPESIRDRLADLLREHMPLRNEADKFPPPQEDIDTPAFREDDITKVCDEIAGLGKDAIPIVLAHHNLLPQAIPRISIYTELINGGLVRSRLANLGRPVIYCHGHIHDDPVEVILSPENTSNSVGLVSISAPAIINGFNLIEIQYGREKTPLGCVVYPYRVHRDGGVKSLLPRRIALQWKNKDDLTGQPEKSIFQCLKTLPPFVFHRFDDIYDKIQARAKKLLNRNIQKFTLSEALLEAEWLGLLEIRGREEDFKYWHAQRIVP